MTRNTIPQRNEARKLSDIITEALIPQEADTKKLREIAADNGIEIVPFPIHRDAIAVTLGGRQYIALNPALTEEQTRRALAATIKAHLTGTYTGGTQ